MSENKMNLTYSEAAALLDFLVAFQRHVNKYSPVVAAGVRAIVSAQNEVFRAHGVVTLYLVTPEQAAEQDAKGTIELRAVAPLEAIVSWALEGEDMMRSAGDLKPAHYACAELLRDWMANQ